MTNEKPLILNEGLWYYVEDEDYKELIIYEDYFIFINENVGTNFFNYSIKYDTLVLESVSGNLLFKAVIQKNDSSEIIIEDSNKNLVLSRLGELDNLTKEMILEEDDDFWNQFIYGYKTRRFKFLEKMKE